METYPPIKMEKLYKCKQCGELFRYDELMTSVCRKSYEVDYGISSDFDGDTFYNKYTTMCPYCRCEELEKGYICSKCLEFVKRYEDDENELCEKCCEDS